MTTALLALLSLPLLTGLLGEAPPGAPPRQFHLPSLLGTLHSLCGRLGAGGVVFYGVRADPEESARSEVWLQRELSRRYVLVASMSPTPSPPTWTGPRRPLSVLLASAVDNLTASLLDQGRSSGVLGLVLNSRVELSKSLEKLHLPLDCTLLVASPGLALSVDLTELWATRPGSPPNRRKYGTWVPHAGFVPFASGRRHVDLQGARLSAAVVHNPPITELKMVNGSLEVRGYFGNVWRVLERRLNFSTRYVVPEDQSVEKAEGDNSCRSMLGLLRCGQVDAALGAFTYGNHGPSELRYSVPLLFTTYRIFIQRLNGEAMNWGDFLSPFSGTLWACLVATIIVIAMCLSTCHKVGRLIGNEEAFGPSRYGFFDSLLAVFGAFCSQGQDVTPRTTPCRAAFVTAYITSVTIVASYSAALISYITISRSTLPFADLEGVLADGTFNFGFVNGSDIYFYFAASNHSVLQQAYRRLVLRDPANLTPNTLAGVRRACDPSARFAFMAAEENVLALGRTANCSLVSLPASWHMVNLAFAVSSSSPYHSTFDRCLRLLRDGGVLHKHRLYGRQVGGGTDSQSPPPSFSSVTLTAVLPLLTVLGSTYGVSLALLLWERSRHGRRRQEASLPVHREWGPRAQGVAYLD